MANFWDNATRGFGAGVVLGERGAERAEDREVRKARLEEEKKRWDVLNKRDEARAVREQAEYDEKKEFKKIKASFDAFHAMYTAGVENDDENMKRSAAAGLGNLYNSKLPNGDEVKIIFKSDSASNPELSKKWDSDPKLKDKEVAVLSKSGGVMPFKNLDDVFKFAASGLNMENFTAGRKQAEAKVAELNAKSEPFRGEDGKLYVQNWKLGPGGMPQKGEVAPYTGVAKESKVKEKMRETEAALGGLRPDDKRKLAGLETSSEIALRDAQAAKARAEATEKGGGKGGKQGLEMTGKQRDIFNKDLKLLLSPFVKKGESVLNPETGEMTEAGDNALISAAKLVEKSNADPNSLTLEEKRYLEHAKKALKIYDKMSAAIAGDYGESGSDTSKPSPKEIEAEAKRRGFVKDANGKWVKPGRGGVTAGY